jgi:hypothetical protein
MSKHCYINVGTILNGGEIKVVMNKTNTFIVTGIAVRNCGREKVAALKYAK